MSTVSIAPAEAVHPASQAIAPAEAVQEEDREPVVRHAQTLGLRRRAGIIPRF
jgi:hypothetical protein